MLSSKCGFATLLDPWGWECRRHFLGMLTCTGLAGLYCERLLAQGARAVAHQNTDCFAQTLTSVALEDALSRRDLCYDYKLSREVEQSGSSLGS